MVHELMTDEVNQEDCDTDGIEGGEGDMAQGRDIPPLLRTARPGLIEEDSHRMNKVASSSNTGRLDMNEGSVCENKVVPSSSVDGNNLEGKSGSTHTKVKCMAKRRFMVKGPACRGQACCKGT